MYQHFRYSPSSLSLSLSLYFIFLLFHYPFSSHPPSNPPPSFSLFYALISCDYPSQNYLFIIIVQLFHDTFLYDTSSDYSALFPNRILVHFDRQDTYCPVCLYLCTYKVLLTQDNYQFVWKKKNEFSINDLLLFMHYYALLIYHIY